MTGPDDLLAAFVDAACVPLDGPHGAGTLEDAERLRAAHPEIARTSILAAAILGDHAAVRDFLERDLASATATGGPRGWDALTHLCFSRYLRLDPSRSDGFVRAARALLDAGASANTGWYESTHEPHPVWESVLYGAAGIAHHAELTHLLLERGADPNDDETPYHTPEGYDNAALRVLVTSGKLTDDSLATMLIRKCDWHDYDGIATLLKHGADPNRGTRWGTNALHQALLRDNALEIIEMLLHHGADPTLVCRGMSAAMLAAWRGRGDVLDQLERRGTPVVLEQAGRLLAACARNDASAVRSLAAGEPRILHDVVAKGGTLLAQFAGNGNTDGVRHLLDLGVSVAAVFVEGDGYFDIAQRSTALHVAAWRARHTTVKLLLERGAPVDVPDARGRTPLALAVRACVASYWAELRSPESVQALLEAGASPHGVEFPSGYADVDALLRRSRGEA